MTQKPNSKSGAQDETEGVENEELFPSKLPWVNTSPQARMVARGLAEQPQSSTTEETTTAVAAADKVAVPAEQSDPEVLTHLKALKKALGSLPDSLEEQLQSLEAKADKTVTHGQINKLGKLQKQLASLGTKISEMDHNWKVFTDKVMQKFATHQQMYQQCRQQLVADFLQKSQEIQAVKEQVQNASVAMFQAHVSEPPQPVEAVDVDALFEAAQEDAYMDMEQGEEEEEDSELVQEKPRPPIGPFRKRLTPVSPTKVHTTHLKKWSIRGIWILNGGWAMFLILRVPRKVTFLIWLASHVSLTAGVCQLVRTISPCLTKLIQRPFDDLLMLVLWLHSQSRWGSHQWSMSTTLMKVMLQMVEVEMMAL